MPYYEHGPVRPREERAEQRFLRSLDQLDHQPYNLDPERQYARDCEMLLRGLAKFVAKFGYAPMIPEFARRQAFNEKAVRKYFDDMAEMGLVEQQRRGWTITEAGSAQINFEHIEPILPTNLNARTKAIAHAKRLQLALRDPYLQEHLDAIPRSYPTE